jgi:hypothetical protein
MACTYGQNANIIKRPSRGLLPDAALAPRVGSLFIEANDALQASTGPPASGDVAREAHMAVRLAELMEQFHSVLWGDRAIFFLQSDPEPQRSITDGQLWRGRQAQALELPKQFTPGLGAFAITVDHR